MSTISEAIEESHDNIWAGYKPATKRAHKSGWEQFREWCRENSHDWMPSSPDVVAAWASSLMDDGKTSRTIRNRVAAVSAAHRRFRYEGEENPAIHPSVQRIIEHAKKHDPPTNAKKPITLAQICKINFSDSLKDLRDRAIIYFGWAAGIARGEFPQLRTKDLLITEKGCIVITEGRKGRQVKYAPRDVFNLPTGPVKALEEWRRRIKGVEGAKEWVFLTVDRWGNVLENSPSGNAIWDLTRARMKSAGIDASSHGSYSVSSLSKGGLRRELTHQYALRDVNEIILHRPHAPESLKNKAYKIKKILKQA